MHLMPGATGSYYFNRSLELSMGIWSLIPLLSVQIIRLVDRTDLFKISNLVESGEEILTSQYSSLERQRQRERLWRV
jgi:hypothetical protein